ncbi:MAG TPA: ABC transporter permease, partial [Vicinamibacteria bacterium]|nr:ABC transporter permease [Vicinamibacteria bacterium]
MPALVSITLGIGASTILFSLIKGVLLAPLPYPEVERLVLLRARNTRSGETRPFVSLLDFRDWQRQASSFDGMALYRWSQLDLPGEDSTERIQGLRVTPEFFRVMGLSAALGRVPRGTTPEEDTGVIVLGRNLWDRRFGADPNLVGETIAVNSWRWLPRLGSVPHQVLAVIDEPSRFLPMTSGLDERFVGVDDVVDFWLPLERNEEAL